MRKWFLPISLVLLTSFGLSILLTNNKELGIKQLILTLLATIVFLIASLLPSKEIFSHHWRWWLGGNLILLIPLLLAISVRGAARWIIIGPLSIQPSQLAFVAISISLVTLRTKIKSQSWITSLNSLFIIIIPAILIAATPDLGTALIFVVSLLTILFLSGLPWKHVFVGMITGIVTMLIAWNFLLYPYQKTRIYSFINPSETSADSTYNLRQSLIAIGSGGISGTGLGLGTQSKLKFLPEHHTDFIFASFAEQYGFLGSILLLTLIFSVGIYLIFKSSSISSYAGQLYVSYVGLLFLMQSMVNIGTNIGLFPISGMTLPLMSAGGSSLIIYAILFGLAQGFLNLPVKSSGLHLV